MRSVLALRGYRSWLAGRTASWVGDALLGLVLSVWVKTITGSSAQAALTFLFSAIPYLLAPAVGLAIDRLSHRLVLVWGNVFSIVALTPLFLVRDASDVPIIWAVTFFYGFSGVTLPAASQAMMRSLVTDEQLADANAVQSSIGNVVSLICPALGAFLFAWQGSGVPVSAAIACFAFAALLILRFRDAPRPDSPNLSGVFWRDLSAGLGHVWRVKPILYTSTSLIIAQFGTGLLEGSIYSVTDAFHRPPSWAGAIVLAQGAGLLAGSLLAATAVRKYGEIGAIKGALAWVGASICAAAFAPSFWFLCGTAMVGGVGVPVVGVAWVTLQQRLTPSGLMGRVQTAAAPFVASAAAVSMGISAWLVSLWSFRTIYPLISGLMFLGLIHLVVYSRRHPAVRSDGECREG